MKANSSSANDNIPIEVKISGNTVPENIREELIMICIYRMINSGKVSKVSENNMKG